VLPPDHQGELRLRVRNGDFGGARRLVGLQVLATSLTPLRNQRLGITAGLTELTGAAGDGPRFAMGASVGLDMKGR
jgi:hypothetical protein